MSSTKMNNTNRRGSMDINNNRRGSMDTKCISTNKQQLQGRNKSRNPMQGFMSKTATSLKTSLIDGALKIVNSPQSSSKPRVSMRRRGSLCTQRQSIELLQDSGDRLSQMMMRNDTSAAFDDDCDYDSDLEE